MTFNAIIRGTVKLNWCGCYSSLSSPLPTCQINMLQLSLISQPNKYLLPIIFYESPNKYLLILDTWFFFTSSPQKRFKNGAHQNWKIKSINSPQFLSIWFSFLEKIPSTQFLLIWYFHFEKDSFDSPSPVSWNSILGWVSFTLIFNL